MEHKVRAYPLYSQCGLNCGLCPNYHKNTTGKFSCTGCSAQGFSQVHPTCSILTCSSQMKVAEFCSDCKEFPCDKYSWMGKDIIYDSFITYQNVKANLEKINTFGFETYYSQLQKRMGFLQLLLKNYNAGRQKNLFCLATNLLPIEDLEVAINDIQNQTSRNDSLKDKAKKAAEILNCVATKNGTVLKLYKK